MTPTSAPREFHAPAIFDEDDPPADGESTTKEIDPDAVLGDLADIVSHMFRTWVGDGEKKWAAQAYLSLQRKGLVSMGGDGADYARNGVLLCAIGALSKEFYVRAFDEGSSGDWTYETPDVIGDYPELSPLSIGRLAERQGVCLDVEDAESPYDVLKALIREYAPLVAAALRAELSDTWLLTYMWAIPSEDVTYPLPDDHEAWSQLHHPSGNAVDAYVWIEDGMPL